MAYRYGNREQMTLLPSSIEEYVGANDPVRAYNAFVEALDFRELGVELDSHKVGNSSYDPKGMLKLIVYGYSYGQRGSRKLERETHHNLSFIWLMGGLRPDHKTISEFRRKNKKAIGKVLKQCARLCVKLDLIEGNTLFIDGSKIRANAGIKNSWTKQRCEKALKKVDKRIEAILNECEKVDKQEENQASFVKMREELEDKKVLKSKVETILKELKEGEEKSINTTDKECVKVKGRQGIHAGYNAQSVVDEKHGLIVHTDVVSESNDLHQFAEQVDQANKNLDKKCLVACADSGYSDTDELKKVADQEIKVIVPSPKQVSKKALSPFDRENFQYDSEQDCYICPEGNILKYSCTHKTRKRREYQIKSSKLCKECRHFGVCTISKNGRKITQLLNEDIRHRFESEYNKPESQQIYKLRQEKVELPFGHIKRNLKVDAFLLRGREGAKAEMSILASCFNMARMITILGVPLLMEKLAA